jgi:hypothetical protein
MFIEAAPAVADQAPPELLQHGRVYSQARLQAGIHADYGSGDESGLTSAPVTEIVYELAFGSYDPCK